MEEIFYPVGLPNPSKILTDANETSLEIKTGQSFDCPDTRDGCTIQNIG